MNPTMTLTVLPLFALILFRLATVCSEDCYEEVDSCDMGTEDQSDDSSVYILACSSDPPNQNSTWYRSNSVVGSGVAQDTYQWDIIGKINGSSENDMMAIARCTPKHDYSGVIRVTTLYTPALRVEPTMVVSFWLLLSDPPIINTEYFELGIAEWREGHPAHYTDVL
ncbi:uncharacterized protein LOC129581905 [Paramacrobiotus metropolitanus]|uniref:uncharacterized protein LOC129581905 n=1 Tax=Paramacrobiotus metropolitanus TaxID=2943436 RepID=UPI0024461173|nr:uncharacterized protein LOC129581905 [Paramacrobiotus metropolitanus]